VGGLAQVGLALATAAGAWINLALLIFAANRRGFEKPGIDPGSVLRLLCAGVALALVLYVGQFALQPITANLPALRDETLLLVLLILGAAVYGAAVLALLGRPWLRQLAREGKAAPARPDLPED
jgi:putative peptidoglycan lipid II flippase